MIKFQEHQGISYIKQHIQENIIFLPTKVFLKTHDYLYCLLIALLKY